MLNIYVANLGKYNEGKLVGAWINLPISEDELDEILAEKVGINEEYEEWAIHDYETDLGIEIGEYDNIYKLNELAEQIEDLSNKINDDLNKLKAILEWQGGDLENYIDDLDDYILIEGINNDYDLGYYYIEEAGIYDLNNLGNLAHYIDYERFGRDINLESDGMITSYGWIERG